MSPCTIVNTTLIQKESIMARESSSEKTHPTTSDMASERAEWIGPDKPFIFFDLELSEQEQECLNNLKISSVRHYENYGDLELLHVELPHFITSLAVDNFAISTVIAQLVIRLVAKIIELTKQESVWVTMRAFTPITAFKEPRWHADTHYYPPTGEQYKVAITLKGSPTLFYNIPLEKRLALEPFRNDKITLSEKIDPSLVVSPQNGEGSIFIVGPEYAPIHSEPHINGNRLFLSMIPGTHEQIQTLYKQTPEQEIIQLLTAHGFYCYFVGPQLKETFVASPYEDTEIIIFKLPHTSDAQLSDELIALIQAHQLEIKTELVTAEPVLLKVTLPRGAIITLNDLSRFFINQAPDTISEEYIYSVLKTHTGQQKELYASDADKHLSVTKKTSSTSSSLESSHHVKFVPISGKNTYGLFKPQPIAITQQTTSPSRRASR